jgi:hypothetical protein
MRRGDEERDKWPAQVKARRLQGSRYAALVKKKSNWNWYIERVLDASPLIETVDRWKLMVDNTKTLLIFQPPDTTNFAYVTLIKRYYDKNDGLSGVIKIISDTHQQLTDSIEQLDPVHIMSSLITKAIDETIDESALNMRQEVLCELIIPGGSLIFGLRPNLLLSHVLRHKNEKLQLYPECAYPKHKLLNLCNPYDEQFSQLIEANVVSFQAKSMHINAKYYGYEIAGHKIKINNRTFKMSLFDVADKQIETAVRTIKENIGKLPITTVEDTTDGVYAKLMQTLQYVHSQNPNVTIDLNFTDAMLKHVEVLFNSTMDGIWKSWTSFMSKLQTNPALFLQAVVGKIAFLFTEGVDAASESLAEGGDNVDALANFLFYFSWVPPSAAVHGALMSSLRIALKFQRFLVVELAQSFTASQHQSTKPWLYPYEVGNDWSVRILDAFAFVYVIDPFERCHAERLHPFILGNSTKGVKLCTYDESRYGNRRTFERLSHICGYAEGTWQFNTLKFYVTLLYDKVQNFITKPFSMREPIEEQMQGIHAIWSQVGDEGDSFRSSSYIKVPVSSADYMVHIVNCVIKAGDAYPLVKYTSDDTVEYVL